MTLKTADKILLSQHIFTVVDSKIRAGGVAISGNQIIAVGSKDEIMQHATADTVIIDYADKMIIPGFCDSHIHLLLGCLFASETDLSAAKSGDEAARILREEFEKKADKYQPDEWVLGFSWYNFNWDNQAYPTKEILDKYFPDRPVFLLNADAHGAWVNSKAFEVAGVDKNTPEVPYGQIFRDTNNEPTGYLSENAMSLCLHYAYKLPKSKETYLIKKALPIFSEVGVTTVNDMQFFFGANMGSLDIYKSLEKSNELTMRIYFANGLLNDLDYSLANSKEYSQGMVRHNGVKEFVDGIITTHTSVMLEKYTDEPNMPIGFELMDLVKAQENINILHKTGMNIHLHATGDGAVRFAVDCYENAIKENGETGSRMSIEHCDLTNPAEWSRMAKAGIIASMQPMHITLSSSLETNEYPKVVGKEREQRLWALNSMSQAGVHLAFGTDYPLVDINPLIGLYKAVTRKFNNGQPIDGWNPHERITLEQALRAYTLGGAYKNGQEKILGTLEAGKLADIVVLDKNIFDIPIEDVPKCKVVMTMVDGKEVYKA